MNYIEFLAKAAEIKLEKDEYGNIYFTNNSNSQDGVAIEELTDLAVFLGGEDYYLLPECIQENSEIDIIEGFLMDEFYEKIWTRRPYYRMRGLPVSNEQAIDILAKTDLFFFDCNPNDNRGKKKIHYSKEAIFFAEKYDRVGDLWSFSNWMIEDQSGWVAPTGRIGKNGIVQKYPDYSQLLTEVYLIKKYFPYLEFCIAMTGENEFYIDDDKYHVRKPGEAKPDFYDYVEYGYYVHDNKIEIVGKQDAIMYYKKYEKACGFAEGAYDAITYPPKEKKLSEDYIKQLIRKRHLDPEEVLARKRIF